MVGETQDFGLIIKYGVSEKVYLMVLLRGCAKPYTFYFLQGAEYKLRGNIQYWLAAIATDLGNLPLDCHRGS